MFSCFHDTYNKESLKNEQDEKWYDLLIQCQNINPSDVVTKPPENAFGQFFYRLATERNFEIFIIFVISLNAVTMALDFQDATQGYTSVLNWLEILFLGIFTLEAIIKMIAFGPLYYLSLGSNRLDFLIVILGIVELLINVILQNELSVMKALQLIRMFRIFRVFR